MNTLRWIVMIPAASIGAWLAYALIRFGYSATTFFQSADTVKTSGGSFFNDLAAHGAMGAAFVIAGTTTAPQQTKYVSYGLCILGAVFGGGGLMLSWLGRDGALAANFGALIVGLVAGAYYITELDKPKKHTTPPRPTE